MVDKPNLKWNKLYKYPNSTRSLIEGSRHYDVSNEILPSVTWPGLLSIKAYREWKKFGARK